MENIRILIVDDLPQVREGLAAVLQLASPVGGSRIEVVGAARSGLEAVQQARDLRPDVILMDMEMPAMDGCEAARRIKAEGSGARMVFLTIHAGHEARQRAQEAGADGFVTKGTGYETLLNAILGRDGSPNSSNLEKGENK